MLNALSTCPLGEIRSNGTSTQRMRTRTEAQREQRLLLFLSSAPPRSRTDDEEEKKAQGNSTQALPRPKRAARQRREWRLGARGAPRSGLRGGRDGGPSWRVGSGEWGGGGRDERVRKEEIGSAGEREERSSSSLFFPPHHLCCLFRPLSLLLLFSLSSLSPLASSSDISIISGLRSITAMLNTGNTIHIFVPFFHISLFFK